MKPRQVGEGWGEGEPKVLFSRLYLSAWWAAERKENDNILEENFNRASCVCALDDGLLYVTVLPPFSYILIEASLEISLATNSEGVQRQS